MSQVGEISVKISGDDKDFNRAIDNVDKGSKRAGKSLSEFSGQVRDSANALGKWAGIAGAAVAALSKIAMTNTKELQNLARAANTTVEEFQRGAYAAQQFGISQEKYGDILKDVNDRVGDFLTTGAGPMVDFFEQIAPKVGVTTDQFKNLSGQQALGLYIQSLEKANLNQQEMTFFMEAIASDSTRLIPLFAKGGKELARYAKAADELGIVLSDVEVEQIVEAERQFQNLVTVLDGQFKQVLAELAPILTNLMQQAIDYLKEFKKEGNDAFVTLEDGASKAATVLGVFGDGLRGIEVIAKGLHIGFAGFAALLSKIFEELSRMSQAVYQGAITPIKKLIEVASQLPDSFGGDTFKGALESLKQFDEGLNSSIQGTERFTQAQVDNVTRLTEELETLLAEPLPSEGIKETLSGIVEQTKEAGEVIKQTMRDAFSPKDESASPYVAPDEGETPVSAGLAGFDPERFMEETEYMKELLTQRHLSLEALDYEHLQRMQNQLDGALQNGLISYEEYAQAKEDISAASAQAEQQILAGSFNAILGAMSKNSKKMLQVQKAFSAASAVVNIAEGITQAMKLPFPLNLAEAARVAAVGATQLSSIRSASAGASAAPSVGGGGGGGSAGAFQAQQPQQPNRVFNIQLAGQSAIPPEQVRGLIGQIGEELNDNVTFNFSGG